VEALILAAVEDLGFDGLVNNAGSPEWSGKGLFKGSSELAQSI